jgi:DNA helicase-2/ATP-dependent DNA helicase PcrA
MDKGLEYLHDFLNDRKSLMIAPAGHGKTHCIANCVSMSRGCSLILTHTHAGIASLKTKFSKANINPQSYHLETITGFVQHYVTSFIKSSEIPEVNDKSYFEVIIEKGKRLFSTTIVRTIIKNSYSCLFVDEYQDCTIEQNSIIMEIADCLPTHLFGDEMQGIFTFNGQRTVSFHNDLPGFTHYKMLTTPWRWKNEGNSEALGYEILRYRHLLELDPHSITLTSNPQASFNVSCIDETRQDYYSYVGKIIRGIYSDSVLIIAPSGINFGTIYQRLKIRDRLGLRNTFKLIEALDDKSFYSVAQSADDLIKSIHRKRKPIKEISKFIEGLSFTKTDISSWINNNKIVHKRSKEQSALSVELEDEVNSFMGTTSTKTLLRIVEFFSVTIKLLPKRENLFYSLVKVMKNSIVNNKSVYDEMVSYKNRVRRSGRAIQGKCIATTLLTKGLEFDHVVILGADKFEDCKNFYVSLSRARKSLTIFTNSYNIKFTH